MASNSATMPSLTARRYPGRCVGAVQRRTVTTARVPLRSDVVLRAAQRTRRISHCQLGSLPRHGKKLPATAAPPKIEDAKHSSLTMDEKVVIEREVAAVDERCQIHYCGPVPCDAESLCAVEVVDVANDATVVCTFHAPHSHAEASFGVEASCVSDHARDVVGDAHTLCGSGVTSCFHDLHAEPSDTPMTMGPVDVPIAELHSPTTELLNMIQLVDEHSSQPSTCASSFNSNASSSTSSLSSSPLPTPRRPKWEKACGRSKSEIEAVLGLGVVTERLRARHGKIDLPAGAAEAWAMLAAAGA